MSVMRTALAELLGMFIDDGALALLNLVLVLAIGLAVETGLVGPAAGAAILVVGCLLVLAESLVRAARRNRRR